MCTAVVLFLDELKLKIQMGKKDPCPDSFRYSQPSQLQICWYQTLLLFFIIFALQHNLPTEQTRRA